MKNIILFLLIGIGNLTFFAFGQSEIKGKIVDENKIPMEHVNVILLEEVDSSYVMGSVSKQDGSFNFSNINNSNYILGCFFLGYEDSYLNVTPKDSIYYIKLVPTSIFLKEVMVLGDKKSFSLQNGNLKIDVQNSKLQSLGNATDLISKLPGVSGDSDYNFEVIGKGKPLIYINGREVIDYTELVSLNTNDIESVELINAPGSQYGGETRSVIKIKTNKIKNQGFAFRLRGNGSIGEKFSNNESIDLFYKNNKWSFRTSFFHYDSRKKSVGKYITKSTSDTIWNIQEKSRGYSEYLYNTINTSVNYEINKNNNISLLHNYSKGKPEMKVVNDMNITADGNDYLKIFNDIYSRDVNLDNRLNFSYLGFINKVSLDLNFDFYKKKIKQDQYNNEMFIAENHTIRTNIYTNYNIFAGKLKIDYNFNDFFNSAGGIDIYNTKRKGSYFIDQDILPNSNSSILEEKYAPYIIVGFKKGAININAGLRYELIKSVYEDLFINEKDQENSSRMLLPNFSIAFPIKKVQLTFSVSQKTKRATYYQLRDGIKYNNRFEFEKGNPYLKSERISSLLLVGAWNNLYFNLNYNTTKDYIGLFFTQDKINTLTKIAIPVNYSKKSDLNFNLNYSKKIGFWSPQLSLTILKPFFTIEYLDKDFKLNKQYAFLQIYNDFNAGRNVILNFDINANTSGNSGESYIYKKMYCNFSARKSIMKSSLDISVRFNDIFKSAKRSSSNSIGSVYYYRNQYNDTRYLSLTVTYNFNNFKAKRSGIAAGDEEINRAN